MPDALNRIKTVTNLSGQATQYQYYPDSQLKQVLYPSSITADYGYNATGQLESLLNKDSSLTLSRYDYEYDDNGNRTQQTEINGGASEITSYGFDNEDRLKTVTYPETMVTYGYDDNFNRTSELEILRSDSSVLKQQLLHYNSRNQLTTIDDALNPADNVSYGYDLSGNQVSKTKAGVETLFAVNARDEIEKITIGGSTVGQFLYDHKGMRIQKIGEQGAVRYTYDDASVLLQTDTDNSLLASYQYGPNRLLSLKQVGKTAEYYLFDALGSPVNLTTVAGEVTARYQYDAWGHKRSETSTSWNRFGFTGHEEDKETGLIYAKARYYDPDTGRFLSQDAFEGFDNKPPSLHKYLYAYGNPTVWTDPTGNFNVLEKDVDKVMRMPNDKGFSFGSTNHSLLEFSTKANLVSGGYGRHYMTPNQVRKLKSIVQKGINYKDGALRNGHESFIYVTREDVQDIGSLRRDVKKMVGGYLNEQDMGRALAAVDGAEQGDAINMSYFRSEAISELNSNSRNFMTEVTDNPISRNFLTSTAEQILRSATITFDLKAPEDIWWNAAVDTAWNASPFLFSKGRYLLKGAKYDVRGMKKFKRKAESQMWRYKNGEDMWPKKNKSWDEVPGTGNDTYIGDSTIITRYVPKKHFKSPRAPYSLKIKQLS